MDAVVVLDVQIMDDRAAAGRASRLPYATRAGPIVGVRGYNGDEATRHHGGRRRRPLERVAAWTTRTRG